MMTALVSTQRSAENRRIETHLANQKKRAMAYDLAIERVNARIARDQAAEQISRTEARLDDAEDRFDLLIAGTSDV